MEQFTGVQYLMIDAANQVPGLDKKLFQERIEWTKANLDCLESQIDLVKPKKKPLFKKACMAIRRAQAGLPMGHMIGFDASCSGIQVMSALTGCVVGATNTGLVDPTKPADAYAICTEYMNQDLNGFDVPRDDAKQALMTMMYGSSEEPKIVFGEDTPELSAFYGAAEKTAPGAYELLQELLGAWQSYAEVHQWTLPDGFLARVRVKTKKEIRITVDELDKASFTYQYSEYEGTKDGISLPANVTHSVDSYVLRCAHRRCNYDAVQLDLAMGYIEYELKERAKGGVALENLAQYAGKIQYYKELYDHTGMADVVILPYVLSGEARFLSTEHLEALYTIGSSMQQHKPFPIVTIHDEFKCHPNNMNHLRQHYINIFAELAESNLLTSLMNEITGHDGVYEKLSDNLGELIRKSNYAIN